MNKYYAFFHVIRQVFENARNGIFESTKSHSVWVRIKRGSHTRYHSHVTRRQILNVSGKTG
jgi:hypothetical protein